ncbi:hypothetical protein Holit_02868 [Hollandina sp. SP2]
MQVFPGIVQERAFGSGPNPGINPQDPGSLNGLLHEQVFEVLAEYGNTVIIRGITLIPPDFPDYRRG